MQVCPHVHTCTCMCAYVWACAGMCRRVPVCEVHGCCAALGTTGDPRTGNMEWNSTPALVCLFSESAVSLT